MVKPKYPKANIPAADRLEKNVKAIDNLIHSGRLFVDMLQGTAAMDSYLWLYYNQQDKLMEGMCVMLRDWINFQRSWKKGELLRLIEEGAYSHIQANELQELCEQRKYPSAMEGKLRPTPLRTDKLSGTASDEQKKQYLREYVNSRYCLWPDAAPLTVLCIGSKGQLTASVEQTNQPPRINYHSHE